MILVAIPYHEHKRYCLDYLFDWINLADTKDCEILLRVHKGTFSEKDAVKTQREFFRKLTLEKDFSHLLLVGCDTIPPLDIVPRLLSHGKDVVGGIYYMRNQIQTREENNAVAWRNGQPEFNKRINLKKETSLLEVDGMGMDCVLFSRNALQTSFFEWEQNDDDYPYYERLKAKGFKIYLDPQVVCKHYDTKEFYN